MYDINPKVIHKHLEYQIFIWRNKIKSCFSFKRRLDVSFIKTSGSKVKFLFSHRIVTLLFVNEVPSVRRVEISIENYFSNKRIG